MLKGADRSAERHPLLGVGEGQREGRFSPGDRTHGHTETLLRKVHDQLTERHTLVAETVRCRHLDIVEEQLGRVLGMEADLVQVSAPLESLHPVLDDEQGETPVRILSGTGDDDDQVGIDPVADERLRAVDDIVTSVSLRRGHDARQIRSRARLRHRDRRHQVTAGQAGQPPFALLIVGVLEEVRKADVVVQGDAGS